MSAHTDDVRGQVNVLDSERAQLAAAKACVEGCGPQRLIFLPQRTDQPRGFLGRRDPGLDR